MSFECHLNVLFLDDVIYEDDINYPNYNINDGTNQIMETPYECWNLCKKTANCVGIAWGKCDSSVANERKSCWLKSAMVGRQSDQKYIAIRYKPTQQNCGCDCNHPILYPGNKCK